MVKLPPFNKYPEYYDYVEMARIESERLQRKVAKHKPYLSHNIMEIGLISKIYSCISSGHKHRAMILYDKLSLETMASLPFFVKKYLHGNLKADFDKNCLKYLGII